jgi:anti-sigma-K factor RskA
MNYAHPELLDRLAADHVTGLMVGRARGRFARLCDSLPEAAQARQRWEDRLLPLALAVPPVLPSHACWAAIERAIAPRAARQRRPVLLAWLAAAAGLVGVAFLVGRQLLVPPVWQVVAVLAPVQAPAMPVWRVERDAQAQRLTIRTLGVMTLDDSKSYELWVLPAGKGGPVSLGVMPLVGTLERTLTADQHRYLLAGAKLAVTLEPAGGSPSGLPTGPVVVVREITGTG